MSSWLLVWYLVAVVTLVGVSVFVVALIREVLSLGRTARRFREEAGPILDDLSRAGSRASERAGSMAPPGRIRP